MRNKVDKNKGITNIQLILILATIILCIALAAAAFILVSKSRNADSNNFPTYSDKSSEGTNKDSTSKSSTSKDSSGNKDSNTSEQSSVSNKGTAPELSLEEIAKLKDRVVLIDTGDAIGSGVIINEDGRIITNYHVIADAVKVYAVFEGSNGAEGQRLAVDILGYNQYKDLALLKLKDGKSHDYISLGNEDLIKIGQKVATIGSPKGFINTVSEGNISSMRELDGVGFIQITAPITNGSSGGALLNMKGELIGITTAEIKDTGNLNFAVSLKEIKGFLKDPESNSIAMAPSDNTDNNTSNSESNSDGYIISYSSVQELTYDDIADLTLTELALARNEIFARHGYIFQKAAYRAYFSSKSWYTPDSNFSEKHFNKVEKYNVDFIKQYEN